MRIRKTVEDQKKAEFLNSEGVRHAQRGDLDKAIELFKSALQYDPFYAEVHHNLAFAYYQKNQLMEALRIAEQLARVLSPNSTEAHSLLAAIYYELKRLPDAAREAEIAITWDSNNGEAHYILARVYFEQKQFSNAKREAQLAQRLGWYAEASELLDAIQRAETSIDELLKALLGLRRE